MKRISEYIKNNYVNILFCTVLIILNVFALNNLYDGYTVGKNFHNYWLIFIISILVEITMFAFIKKFYNKNSKIENIFLLIVIPIGIMYLLLIPIGRVPDERNHFARAYEISEGHLISSKDAKGVGGQVINSDIEDLFKTSSDRYNYNDTLKNITKSKSNNKKFIQFANMSLYSFVCYIPQVIGITVGRILALPTLMIAYLGRLTNFAVWIGLMYMAIKLIPYKKLSILIFGLMPMMLQEAASLSADALTNGIAFLLISYTLYLKHKNKNIDKKEFSILSIFAIVMSLCKIVYLPICLILLLLPYKQFNSKKDKYLKIGLLALFVIVINLIWLKISSSFLIEFRDGVDPTSQVYAIMHHPLTYIQIFYNTIYEYITLYLFNIVGFSLCYFDVNPSYIYVLLYLFIIIYSLIVETTKIIDNKDKLVNGIIFISTIILMFTSLYVQWTPLGASFIDGVQGRYFIPLLIPIAILANNSYIKINEKTNSNLYIYNFIVFINIYVLLLLFFNHIY